MCFSHFIERGGSLRWVAHRSPQSAVWNMWTRRRTQQKPASPRRGPWATASLLLPSATPRVKALSFPAARRMSGATGNLDCEECLSSAQVADSAESQPHPVVDDDDELLRYIWTEYLHPKQYEWVLIVAYILVFCVSLIGNSLGEF